MENRAKLFIKKCVFCIAVIAIILCAVLPVIRATDPSLVECETVELDEGWNVIAHGRVYENIRLSQTLFDMCNRNDVVSLSIRLPEKTVTMPVLKCYSVHSTVDVYLDGQNIYSYGNDLFQKGDILGYGWHYIRLPADYEGKTLEIMLCISEDSAFEGIPEMSIMDGSRMMQKELAMSRFNLAISLFLILFGILGMFLSLIMYIRNSSFIKTFCIMLFSFTIGLWTFCNSDLILLYTTDLRVKVYMEYISFYALDIPLLYYFADRVKSVRCPKYFKVLYWSLLTAEVVLFGFILLMQQMNILHFPVFVPVQHFMILLTLLFIFAFSLNDYRRTKKIPKGLSLGFALAGVLAFWELIRYNLSKYFIGFSNNKYNSTMQLAALIIVLALFVDFAGRVFRNLQKEAQRALLEKMAYMDELSCLSNRRKCDEDMLAIEKEGKPYAIVSLDMNLLKHINDTYGHEAGDAAIQSFARVLKESFPEQCTIGRMGGDEFLVLAAEADSDMIEQYLKTMKEKMQACTVEHTDVKLSAAYGCAYSCERENAHAVYSLADERMYENKRLSKLGRQA